MVICTDENGERVTCTCNNEDPDYERDEMEIYACELFVSNVSVVCTYLARCTLRVH